METVLAQRESKRSLGLTRTRIDWADFSWNPVTGCLNRCPYCYARKLTVRFPDNFPQGFAPSFLPDRLASPFMVRKPAWFFCGSMGDLFWHDKGVLKEVFQVMSENLHHRFVVLTKTLERATYFVRAFRDFPPNLWMGVSMDGMYVPASSDGMSLKDWLDLAVRCLGVFSGALEGRAVVSFEPLLAPIPGRFLERALPLVDWVIIGGQTGPRRVPEPGWIEEIIARAKSLSPAPAVFVKANAGADWSEC